MLPPTTHHTTPNPVIYHHPLAMCPSSVCYMYSKLAGNVRRSRNVSCIMQRWRTLHYIATRDCEGVYCMKNWINGGYRSTWWWSSGFYCFNNKESKKTRNNNVMLVYYFLIKIGIIDVPNIIDFLVEYHFFMAPTPYYYPTPTLPPPQSSYTPLDYLIY